MKDFQDVYHMSLSYVNSHHLKETSNVHSIIFCWSYQFWDISLLYHSIVEQQNSWGWKGLSSPSAPTSAQADTPRAGCSRPCPSGSWRSPWRKSDNLCQCSFSHIAQKSFLMFRGNFLCSSLYPLPLVLTLSTTEKSLAPSSLHPPNNTCWETDSPKPEPSQVWTGPAHSTCLCSKGMQLASGQPAVRKSFSAELPSCLTVYHYNRPRCQRDIHISLTQEAD